MSEVPPSGGAGNANDLPYSVEFDFGHAILMVRWHGEVDDGTISDAYERGQRLYELLKPRYGIMDFTKATAVNLAPSTIQLLAHTNPIFPPGAIRVIIARSQHMYGLARMFELISDGRRTGIHVVHSEAEALEILGGLRTHFEAVPLS